VNALANDKVGEFFNKHFVSTYQKVGTFKIVNGQKQGGNVASYFCLGDGSVLHAIAGPTDAETMLREAKWVVETRKLATLEANGNIQKYAQVFRKAHCDRLASDQGIHVDPRRMQATMNIDNYCSQVMGQRHQLMHHRGKGATVSNKESQMHVLLAVYPLVKLDKIYKLVFESVLNQRVSTQPVAKR
jgi:hypothetical protein